MSEHPELTIADANRRLPLVRAIVRDAIQLRADVTSRQERLNALREEYPDLDDDSPYAEEVLQMEESVENDEVRLDGYAAELKEIGADLVDSDSGLVEFTSTLGDRSVRLSWLFDEPEVAFWRADWETPADRRPLELSEQETA